MVIQLNAWERMLNAWQWEQLVNDLKLPALVSGGTLPSYCILSPCYVLVAQCFRSARLWMLPQWTRCSIRWQTWSGLIVSVAVSCWSVAHVQRASSRLLEGTQQSSHTCHSQKIVLHSSRMSKQPRGLKQYHKSNDFIYSFNTKMSSSSQYHPRGLWGRPTVS